MMNYMKSERYRLTRKKSLHLVSIVAMLLIIACAFVLNYFGQSEDEFLYATSFFLYGNVINAGLLIFIFVLIVSRSLTGKDQLLLKQSISFGISRHTIFWSKLLVTLLYFIFVCLVGMLLVIGLGEILFPKDDESLRNFLQASMNMIPIVISGFFLVHVLKMNRMGDMYVMIIVIFIYTMSDSVFKLLFRRFELFNELYKWTPSALLNNNTLAYAHYTASFEWTYWAIGIGLSILVLSVGIWNFNRKDID